MMDCTHPECCLNRRFKITSAILKSFQKIWRFTNSSFKKKGVLQILRKVRCRKHIVLARVKFHFAQISRFEFQAKFPFACFSRFTFKFPFLLRNPLGGLFSRFWLFKFPFRHFSRFKSKREICLKGNLTSTCIKSLRQQF